jgi:holo-[acyl-carrier protein] synthase
MIVGVGLDMEEIPRFAALLERWGDRITHRLFTEGEREYASGKAREASHYAARFAAKEAALKALSVPRGLSWHEMEVVGGGSAPPRLVLTGRAREAADALGVDHVHLTLTHTDGIAAAVVIAESAGVFPQAG